MAASNPSPELLIQQAKTLAELFGDSLDAKVKKDLERQLEVNSRSAFVYLLSTSWFEKWRAASGFDSVRDGISVEPSSLDTDEPLPVINDDIVDQTFSRGITKPGILRAGQEYLDVVLKRGIVESEFFIYITHDIWAKLKFWYPNAIMVKRRAYYNAQQELSYEIHCHLANVYFYSSKFIQHEVRGTSGAAAPKVALQISNLMTIGSIYDLVISILNKSSEYIPSMKSYLPFTLNTDSCQIFFLNEGNEYAREVQKKVANSSSPNDDSFTLEGTLLSKKRETLGQTLREVGIHLDASCAFIVDVKKYDGFFFDVKSNDKSDSDDEMFNMKGSNKSALNNTWKTNSRFGGSSNHQSAETYRPGISRMGVVGLKNLGNTCYMNSALQCLSNCKELTEYFLKNEHKQDENPDNVLGSKCKLVEAYAGLVNRLWYGDEDRIAPSDFKYEIGNFQSAFEGMNQHDSQELLSRLLDGLHEDLNIIQKKPYIEDKDCTDKDDGPQVAKTYWTNFLRRNYSKIIQSFYGQFRSQIKCPECEHVSVRYDPFELVSLPVPRYEVMEYRFSGFQISKNQDKQAKKVSFTVKADNKHIPKVATVMEEFAKAMADGQPGNRYIMCFSGFSVHGDDIPLSSTVADVHNKNRDTFYRPKIFVFEKTDEEMAIEQKPDSMHILCLSKLLERENDRYASPEHPSFAKMVWGAEETTVEELYYRIFVKFAHFINTQELGIETKKKEDDSRELAPYPAFVEDYQKLFKECMGNQKFNHKFLFRIKWGGEYLQYDSKQTLGELIKSAGSFAKDSGEVEHWNNASRLLKLDVWLDPVIKEYVSIDYMKKIQSDEIDVVFDSVQKDEEEGKKHNIHSLIKKFCEPEVLDDHNLYNCSQCKKRVNGLKQVNIYKAPKYLILHMKKLKDNYGFRWSSSSSNDHLMVDFEVDNFDLTPHLLDKEPISCYNIPKEDFMDKGNRRLEDRIIPEFTWTKDSMVYDCFGVINHYGSMHFGHYTAFAKNNGQWYCYDDSTVTKVDDPRSIVTTAAYVVFYERRD